MRTMPMTRMIFPREVTPISRMAPSRVRAMSTPAMKSVSDSLSPLPPVRPGNAGDRHGRDEGRS